MNPDDKLRHFFQAQRQADTERVPVFRPVTHRDAPAIAWPRLTFAAALAVVLITGALLMHRLRPVLAVDTARWAVLSNWSAATDTLLSSACPTPWDSIAGFDAGSDTTTKTTERSTL